MFGDTLEQIFKQLQDLPMTDPVAYAELRHRLASDPQLSMHASDIFQPHRSAGGGLPAQASSNVDFLELQALMSKQQQMYQAISNILKSMHDMQMTPIRNLRG